MLRALRARRDKLLNDPDSPVAGNCDGDVTRVELFADHCPSCKRVHAGVQELLRADRNIRFADKEWPLRGPDSVFAARAPGKDHPFHAALMDARGALTEAAVLAAAKGVGLDVDRLTRAIAAERDRTDASFARTSDLAAALEIRGTAAFVIGDVAIRGAIDIEDFKKVIADARHGAR